jgi:hypothetical protein
MKKKIWVFFTKPLIAFYPRNLGIKCFQPKPDQLGQFAYLLSQRLNVRFSLHQHGMIDKD